MKHDTHNSDTSRPGASRRPSGGSAAGKPSLPTYGNQPPLRPRSLPSSLTIPILISLLAAWATAASAGAAPTNPSTQAPPAFTPTARTYDVGAHGIPRFVKVDYIELAKIAGITRFRSAEGHDYSDSFESCRSMKHYFKPKDQVDWSSVKIAAPVAGKVFRVQEEWAGTKIEVQAQDCPAFSFAIFHVKLLQPLKAGDTVTAGQKLGTHIGPQTFSDIAVSVQTPKGRKLLSYFDVMTDTLFQAYQARGVASREALIITTAARDADPLSCQEGKFATRGTIENWVLLL